MGRELEPGAAAAEQASIRSILRSAILVGAIAAIGVIGFKILGGAETTFLDALYMTAVTLSTVGYAEVVEVSQTAAGKVFTIALLLGGVSGFLYFFSSITAFLVEGTLDHFFWRRRMDKTIRGLNDHVIVCGSGDTGTHVVVELVATQRGVVLVDASGERVEALAERLGKEIPCVIGDATDDATLRQAGIERASGLVTCLGSDKDNLVVTFSARRLKADLRIISRCTEPAFEGKLKSAGADAVVSPNHIGGLRMVSEMVRPSVVSFLDTMLRDRDRNLRFEEVTVGAGSTLDGATVGTLHQRKLDHALLIALREPGGRWIYFPDADEPLTPGIVLVVIGDPAARAALERLAHA